MTENTAAFHDSLTVIDGCQFSNWFNSAFADGQACNIDQSYFDQWRAGGLTAVNVTVSVWEGTRATLDNISRWYRVIQDYPNEVMLAACGADIDLAKAGGKTGVILGMQNTSAFEDDLGMVEVFHRLGVRFAQATYNMQNFVGASCYDPVDTGLTRFGKFVLAEMNRVGMVMDTSHVGARTTLDCVEHSTRPVVATHANPLFFLDHPRNKSEDVMRALARSGGMIGLATYPALCAADTTLESWCAMVARTVDMIGVEHVGMGSDCAIGWSTQDAMAMNMWHWSHQPHYGAHSESNPGWDAMPDWWPSSAGYPNITTGLLAHGFSKSETAAIMGGNWLRVCASGFEAD